MSFNPKQYNFIDATPRVNIVEVPVNVNLSVVFMYETLKPVPEITENISLTNALIPNVLFVSLILYFLYFNYFNWLFHYKLHVAKIKYCTHPLNVRRTKGKKPTYKIQHCVFIFSCVHYRTHYK